MISGGVKFFERSKCLINDDTTVNASTGQASAERCIDRNPITYWRSVGSNDMITEELEIVFNGDQTFDRIFLQDHNFKSYNIKYYSGGTYVHFSNVTGLSGSLSNITETVYSRDTSYYEFNEVTTSKIRIQIVSTQVANDQKYISQVIVTSELGTLQGYPEIKGIELNRQIKTNKMLSGRVLADKSDEVFEVDLDFKNYPASLEDDINLMFTLHDLDETFLIWLCGGRYGSNYFKQQMRGYRLRDIYPVQMIASVKPIYSNNVFVNTVNLGVQFKEAVD
jgi:hypothetical protein